MGGGFNLSPFFVMEESTKIVSSAILGLDMEVVVVNDKQYVIMPPTIHKIASVGYHLSGFTGKDMDSVLRMMTNIDTAAKALSCLIEGDDSLSEELSKAPLHEVVEALKKGISLISVENFIVLSGLARNVAALIAKPRP